MFLADSNIIIYSYLPSFGYLKETLTNGDVLISDISHVEILGYYKITAEEEKYFKDVFRYLPSIEVSKLIIGNAIEMRKKNNLKLGDSLIAATAIAYDLTLYTRNLKDFEKILELKIL